MDATHNIQKWNNLAIITFLYILIPHNLHPFTRNSMYIIKLYIVQIFNQIWHSIVGVWNTCLNEIKMMWVHINKNQSNEWWTIKIYYKKIVLKLLTLIVFIGKNKTCFYTFCGKTDVTINDYKSTLNNNNNIWILMSLKILS